jgi:hypothetical protein
MKPLELFVLYFVKVILFIDFFAQTSISVEFRPTDSQSTYVLQWKEHPQSWDTAKSMELLAGAVKAEAEDLQPGTTYCIRLASKDGGQQPGPELIIDTEQVGCTPKADKSCCVIL